MRRGRGPPSACRVSFDRAMWVCSTRILILVGRVHPEIVQAALPHTDHACVVEQFLDPCRGGLIEVGGVVGMHARRGEHTLEGIGQFGGSGARGGVDTDADQPVDARGLRGLDHLCRFAGRAGTGGSGCPPPRCQSPVEGSGRSSSGELTRVSTYGRCGELHVKHDSGKPHPRVKAWWITRRGRIGLRTPQSASRRGKSDSPLVVEVPDLEASPLHRRGHALTLE